MKLQGGKGAKPRAYLFASYCYTNEAKENFIRISNRLKIGGKITVVEDDELEDLGVALDYNTGVVVPGGDVTLLGLSAKGESLQIVPKKGNDDLDFKMHSITGRFHSPKNTSVRGFWSMIVKLFSAKAATYFSN